MSHKELASVGFGNAYGHVPGHQYHDVDVVVSSRGNKFRVHVVESWGQMCSEYGRREAIGRGDSIRDAIDDARSRAKDCGIDCEYLEQSLSRAEDSAEDEAEDSAEEASDE